MIPFNKDTMMMIALITIIASCIYLYRELQTTKKDMSAMRNRPQVVFTPPQQQQQQPQRPVPKQHQVEIDEIKPEITVADEQ
jgi:hypothetical protein